MSFSTEPVRTLLRSDLDQLVADQIAYNALYNLRADVDRIITLFGMTGEQIATALCPILPDGMEPCGKFWHKTKKEAIEYLEREKPSAIRGPGWTLNAYYCYGCDGFHVGQTRDTK